MKFGNHQSATEGQQPEETVKPWTIYARMGEQNTDFHYLNHVWDNLREMENQFETVFDPMDKENWNFE